MHPLLRLGTRSSKMAMIAAERARDLILAAHPQIPVQILPFASEGCLISGDLKDVGGKGLFIKDLERRLLAGEIDCALHTLKDVPGDLPLHPDLTLLAFLDREDPRDALVLRAGIREEDLSHHIVGTSAPRRTAILHRLYPGVRTTLSRGNVDSRIRHLDSGKYDALVLSAAGLDRLGLTDRIVRRFEPSEMLPAVGQGIVCLQVRKVDADRCSFLREVNNAWSETAATVERGVLSGLQGNCHSAIAAHCYRSGKSIVLEALVLDDASGTVVKSRQACDAGSVAVEQLGALAAADLLKQGAAAFL
jgi:hydroxymethylbilane synthase